jgi:DivIVA domain-containing protein
MVDLEDHEGDSAPEQELRSEPAQDETTGVLERLRSASFATARRGYDRRQVDEFLLRITRLLESESRAFDPEVVKRRLQEVGESTTGILTAAEETARKLQTDASAEADRLHRTAAEAAEQVRSEAREFAETTRESATEDARRLRMEATRKAEEIVSSAEARVEELLERSLERRQVLDASIERLLDRRVEVADRLRDLSGELRRLADDESDDEEFVDEEEAAEDSPPRREIPDFGFDDEDDEESGYRDPE